MTAFLFIPSNSSARFARRVDFTNIASLFVEGEELPRAKPWRHGVRIAAMVLLVLLAAGDTILIAHSNALDWCIASQVQSGPDRNISL